MVSDKNEFRLTRLRYTPTPDGKGSYDERLWLRLDGYTHFCVTLEVPLEGDGYVEAHIFNYTNIRYTAELNFQSAAGIGPDGVRMRVPHDNGGLNPDTLPLYMEELKLAQDAMAEIVRRFCCDAWKVERGNAKSVIPQDNLIQKTEYEFQAETDAGRNTGEEYTLTVYCENSTEKHTLYFSTLLDAIIGLTASLAKNSHRRDKLHSHAKVTRKGCTQAVVFGTWKDGRVGTELPESDPDYIRIHPYLSQYRD